MTWGNQPKPALSRNERAWRVLLPPTVAQHQAAYERRHAILRAVEAGARVVDIARHIGLSKSNVYIKLRHAERDTRNNRSAPVIRFCGPNQVAGLFRSPEPEPTTVRQTWHQKYVEAKEENDRRAAETLRRQQQHILLDKSCARCRMPLVEARRGSCWGGNGPDCYWPLTIRTFGAAVAVQRAQHLGSADGPSL